MEGRKRRTAVFLLLLACWLLVLSGNGLAQTWQKVVPCASAAGSGTPTYLGLTSGSYYGAQVGGYIGANAKCVAQYGAGARMMTITDKRKIDKITPYDDNGWVDIRLNNTFSSNEIVVDDYGPTGYQSLAQVNCNSFSSNAGYNFYLSTNGAIQIQQCGNPVKIHCVKD